MKLRCHIYQLFVALCLLAASVHVSAQPGYKVDIKKPKPYEERVLKAEKTGDGKLKAPRRILQNLTTRFNYYFNANNLLTEIIDRAREQHKDDYSSLLSFYNYSLDATAADSAQLDSVIYKARTGIVNHDLRNEWLDELYLLWGAAFHLQKKLDSAYLMFQFINYAYAPQDEDGFYKYIGTRVPGSTDLSISTKEDKKLLHSNTFSRNNSFIWQIKTLIELGDFTSSGSMITTLKRDPAFPKRLRLPLDEAEAYWWYKQQRWDSAVVHLVTALEGAETKLEKARWEYLAAQLYEKIGKRDEAEKLYAQAISLTPDPVMDVYARLNTVRLSKDGGENAIDKNVAALVKMAKRDKYDEYRDVIYYMAAQMEMERNNIAAAQELLIEGSKYNNANLASRSKTFLLIADVSYNQKKYTQAASFYDSIQISDLTEAEAQRVNERRPPLQQVVLNTSIIARQDSLQRIAAMPMQERDAYIAKLVKKLRKAQGLKEEAAAPNSGNKNVLTTAPPTDLFPREQKGEWYFYNANLKTQGLAQFKRIWGSRPNIDNWRRYAMVSQQLQQQTDRGNILAIDGDSPGLPEAELTPESLLAKLPTTPVTTKASNDSIKNALFELGSVYLNGMEDYISSINAYEELRRRFPDAERMDEVLFNLYYAYTKSGNPSAAAAIKKLMQERHASSRYTSIVANGTDPQSDKATTTQVTKEYERIYNLFIEGRFTEAQQAKRIADSTYQTNKWQPQLLYIEAVYNIRQRQDSLAKNSLAILIAQQANTPLADKAQTLLDVLSRRAQIEDELSRYQIKTDSTTVAAPVQKPVVVAPPPVLKDTVVAKPKPKDTVVAKPITPVVVKAKDTVAAKPVTPLVVKAKDIIAVKPKEPIVKPKDTIAVKPKEPVVKLKDTVAVKPKDAVAKPKDTVAAKPKLPVVVKPKDTIAIKPTTPVVVAKPRDTIVTDTVVTRKPKEQITKVKTNDSLGIKAPGVKPLSPQTVDTIVRRPGIPKLDPVSGYTFVPDAGHYAVVVLDKVDIVFASEAKNAFFRYNRERYSKLSLDIQPLELNGETKLLLIGNFTSAQAAVDYAQQAKASAARDIIPWLTNNKYSFSIISPANLELLKSRADIRLYKLFLDKYLPVKL